MLKLSHHNANITKCKLALPFRAPHSLIMTFVVCCCFNKPCYCRRDGFESSYGFSRSSMNGVWIFVNAYPLIKILRFISNFSFLLFCFLLFSCWNSLSKKLLGFHCLWINFTYFLDNINC